MSEPSTSPRFTVDRELGRGATARVWHAILEEDFADHRAGDAVAVKYLRNADAGHESLMEEAAAARSVRARGLVRALHVGRDERGPYLMMEYVPGRTLREVLDSGGPLPEPIVRSVLAQVAGGLAALHSAGYIHGDIKPENIRLDEQGRAVLVDLGFARRSSPADELPRRAEEERSRSAGTLLYLSPERLAGGSRSESGDVYALGAVAYELATGRHPFVGDLAAGKLPRFTSSGDRNVRARAVSKLARSSDVQRRSGAERSSAAGSRDGSQQSPEDLAPILERLRRAQFVVPSRHSPTLSPFLDALLHQMLLATPRDRVSSKDLSQIAVDQEAGTWWRSMIDFQAGERTVGTLAAAEPHLTPLVGRQRELATLFEALDDLDPLRDGDDSPGAIEVVWLEGPAGSGKSRLAQTFATVARRTEHPPLFLYGRCHKLRDERPCQPLLRMLQRYLGLPRRSAPAERDREHLESLVPPADAATLVRSLEPGFEGATEVSVPAALSSWLLAVAADSPAARQSPLIVLLDDLNHADAETLRVLTRVARGARDKNGARMLLLLNVHENEEARHPAVLETLRTQLEESCPSRSLALGALSPAALKELVETIFAPTTPHLRLARVLWERSRGNPAFVSEIVRGLIQRGQARFSDDEGAYELTIPPEDLPLPRSLGRAVVESYRALPKEDRLWLQRLAIVGGRIETEFLKSAFPPATRAEIDDTLAELVRTGWLTAAGARYRFSRPALRETVYRALPALRRRTLHAAAARALAPTPGSPISIQDAFQRAFHLRAAERHEDLLRLIRPLLRRLLARGLVQRVFSLSRWGLEALDALPRTDARERMQIELLEAAADAADRLGQRDEQRELLDRLSDLELHPDQDAELLGRIYLLHGRYAVSTGRYGLARGWLDNAAKLFKSADARSLRSEALRRLAAVQEHVGDFDEARALARKAYELAETDFQRALALLVRCATEVLRNRLDKAIEKANEALRLLRGMSDRMVDGAVGNAYLLRARIYRAAGRPLRALAAADRALDLARRSGERRLEAEAGARLGGLLLAIDRRVDAEARLREAWLAAEEIEDRRGQALAALFLSVPLAEDDREEGRRWIDLSCHLARETGLSRVEALAVGLRARFSLRSGDIDAAERDATAAAAIVERLGAELFDQLVIEGTLALVRQHRQDFDGSEKLREKLQRRIRRDAGRLSAEVPRRRLRSAAQRLLDAVLTTEGPIYPRLRALPFEGSSD